MASISILILIITNSTAFFQIMEIINTPKKNSLSSPQVSIQGIGLLCKKVGDNKSSTFLLKYKPFLDAFKGNNHRKAKTAIEEWIIHTLSVVKGVMESGQKLPFDGMINFKPSKPILLLDEQSVSNNLSGSATTDRDLSVIIFRIILMSCISDKCHWAIIQCFAKGLCSPIAEMCENDFQEKGVNAPLMQQGKDSGNHARRWLSQFVNCTTCAVLSYPKPDSISHDHAIIFQVILYDIVILDSANFFSTMGTNPVECICPPEIRVVLSDIPDDLRHLPKLKNDLLSFIGSAFVFFIHRRTWYLEQRKNLQKSPSTLISLMKDVENKMKTTATSGCLLVTSFLPNIHLMSYKSKMLLDIIGYDRNSNQVCKEDITPKSNNKRRLMDLESGIPKELNFSNRTQPRRSEDLIKPRLTKGNTENLRRITRNGSTSGDSDCTPQHKPKRTGQYQGISPFHSEARGLSVSNDKFEKKFPSSRQNQKIKNKKVNIDSRGERVSEHQTLLFEIEAQLKVLQGILCPTNPMNPAKTRDHVYHVMSKFVKNVPKGKAESIKAYAAVLAVIVDHLCGLLTSQTGRILPYSTCEIIKWIHKALTDIGKDISSKLLLILDNLGTNLFTSRAFMMNVLESASCKAMTKDEWLLPDFYQQLYKQSPVFTTLQNNKKLKTTPHKNIVSQIYSGKTKRNVEVIEAKNDELEMDGKVWV